MFTTPISLAELTIKTPGCVALTELLEEEDLQRTRAMQGTNQRAVVEELATMFVTEAGTLAQAVSFVQHNGEPLTAYNYLTEECYSTESLSVVFLGEMIMDLFHADKLIKTSEFLEKLHEMNPYLALSAEGCPWLFEEGTDFMELSEMMDYSYEGSEE